MDIIQSTHVTVPFKMLYHIYASINILTCWLHVLPYMEEHVNNNIKMLLKFRPQNFGMEPLLFYTVDS